jgi:hypothetical protein
MSGVRGCLFALALAAHERAPEPLHALAQLEPEPAGAHCSLGGLAARFGLDLDRDGALSASEVDLTSYVCTIPMVRSENRTDSHARQVGASQGMPARVHRSDSLRSQGGEPSRVNGLEALLGLTELPARGYCAAGGLSVSAGLDQDGDRQLDEAEITDVEHLCLGSAVLGAAPAHVAQ